MAPTTISVASARARKGSLSSGRHESPGWLGKTKRGTFWGPSQPWNPMSGGRYTNSAQRVVVARTARRLTRSRSEFTWPDPVGLARTLNRSRETRSPSTEITNE